MYCERCNVDFPEGLRYCKWCGGPLVDRPRVTSELHSCPSCSAAVQPGWAFCKSCGERLQAAAREPVGAVCPSCGAVTDPGALNCLRCGTSLTGDRAVAQVSADTAVISMCSSCGERLDTGSLYCKACGSAVYTEEKPFGGSTMLCGVCKSYSPLGSRTCRVCGAPFVQAAKTVVDQPAYSPPVQRKSDTLPDLEEHLPTGPAGSGLPGQKGVESVASTLVFTEAVRGDDQIASQRRDGVETNMLPGTSGAKSEQQAPTSIMQMGRTTGPVEGDASEREEANAGSGYLRPAAPVPVVDQHPGAAEQTVEFAAPPQDGAAPPGHTTAGFGSDSASSPVDSEGKTEIFVSPSQVPVPPAFEQVSQEDVGTREFVPPSRWEQEATREFQPSGPGAATNIAGTTGQISSAPRVTPAEPIEPSAPADLSPAEVQAPPVSQVASHPLPKKRTGVVIASAVVSLIVIGGAIFVAWWFLIARPKPAPQPPPPVAVEQPPPVAPPVEKPAGPVVPEGMLAVAAGNYTIGRDGADPLEQPQHKVDLPAFFLDRTEVTNAAYKKFVDATGRKAPTNWTGSEFPQGRDNYPVTGVTWRDAADYAKWAGKRLPTEIEWEAAARGADGRVFPWGNDWRSGVANIGGKPDDISADQYPQGIKEVGRYPQGASPAGAVDMIGNAWEWVADEISPYPGNTETKLTLKPGVTYRVIRGGAYDGNKVHDATYRGFLDGSEAYPKVGFRCAKDAK